MKKILALLGTMLLAATLSLAPAAAGTPRSAKDSLSADTLDLIRARYDVDHIIVGHTIFRQVSTFYDGRVIDVNVDNAVNRKKKRSRALLIEDGQYYSVTDRGKRKKIIKD